MPIHRHAVPALLALTSLAGLAAGQEYDAVVVEALSQFGIPECYFTGLNNHDTATGWMTYTTQDSNGNFHTTYHGFLWTDDGGPVVDQVPLRTYADINDNGDLLASSTIFFADGTQGFMQVVPGDRAIDGNEINESGMVVGTSTYRFYSGCRYERRAVVWTKDTGTINLEAFVPSADVGRGINNLNEVVGVRSFSGSCGDFEAFLYRVDTDEWINLHSMLVGSGPGITEANAVNDLGQVAGEGWNGTFASGWVWDPAEGFTFLPALGQGDRDRLTPSDINNRGVVVGSAATDGWADWHAFIWDADAGIRDLNDLATLPDGFILDRATEINERGVIVGEGHWGPSWGPAVGFVLFPREAGCAADFNGDGDTNTLDVLAFLNAWNTNDAEADFNEDGEVNTLDVLAFLNAWNAGC